MSHADVRFMAEALRLARLGLFSTHPNPRVGCVIVKDNLIVGRGFHKRTGGAHAERMALNEAGPAAKGACVYVTLEPCSHKGRTESCADALIHAQVRKVYAALVDPNPMVSGKGFTLLREAGIKVETGILAQEARELNIGFFHRHTLGRPWVRCKLATSLNGMTVVEKTTGDDSHWITSKFSRNDVHLWRARSSAIVSTAKSVAQDNSRLNVRLDQHTENSSYPATPIIQPLRVLLDRTFSLPTDALFFKEAGAKLWVGAQNTALPRFLPKETTAIRLDCNKNSSGICLSALLKELAKREINEVFVEAGASLIASFFNAQLADEFLLYMAVDVLPGKNVSWNFDAKIKFQRKDIRFFGDDIRILLRPVIKNACDAVN